MSWAFDASRPIFTQITERLTEDILCGRYPPGSRLPSVRELAAEAAVNPNTVQRALTELENAGLAVGTRGAGRCVTGDAAVIAEAQRTMAVRLSQEYLQRMTALGIGAEEIGSILEEIYNGGKTQ